MNNTVEVKNKTFNAFIWKFLERFISQGISLLISIIIARILNPNDYGIVSLVTIFFTFANVFVIGGLNTALIQKKDANPSNYGAVLIYSIVLSILIYLILFFLAPVISNAFSENSITLMIRIMGISLPVNAIKSIYCASVSSKLEFKKFFFATLIGSIISGVLGIYFALNGLGPWALIIQQLTNIFVGTLALVSCTKLSFKFNNFKESVPLFKYGYKILLSNLLATIYSEASPLAIGIRFDNDDLSYYTKGRSFPSMLSSSIISTFSAVLFPMLAKYQDDKEKILKYTRMYMKLSSFCVFPLLLGFFAVADNFVIVLLTDKWYDAIYFIRIFCICYMVDIIATGNCETIKAIGKSGVFLTMEIIKKSLYFIILILFIIFSKTPKILVLFSFCSSLISLVVNSIPNIKLIGYKIKYQFSDLIVNLIPSIIMCFIVLLVGTLEINLFLLFILQILVGIVSYLLLCVLFKNANLKYLFNFIKERIKNSK